MKSALETVLGTVSGLGRATIFFFQLLVALPHVVLRPRVFLRQLYMVGALSLVIIVVSGSFVGMVLGLQGYRILSGFGATASLGIFVAFTVVRELGPVVTGLLFAGRAGSALAAEIGLMRATDQLSGMEMMAVDPMRYVAAPRFLAGFIAMPLLTAIFSVMAIGVAGGYLIGVTLLGVDPGAFWSQIHADLHPIDILQSMIKALVFGAAISWIAVYQGYHAAPNSEGVAHATTTTVVASSLAVLGLDFILTALMFR
ncbi:MAG TPA: lipid asymmetry maintenance ABC transporter permease subunit MlaE [Nevskiaceae bacterium]|nr:lipid asymmetry maintenance ABC transporter permease subunit MlaE [Nevskiaceae bacterium]